MSQNKVYVTADLLGNVIGQSKNEEYGYIRVEQVVPFINHDGWLKLQKRSALIKGKISDLKSMNFKEGDVLPGKIIVKEQLVPFYPEDPQRNLKMAGSTGIPCTLDDQAIYRETFYTTDESAQDQLIPHNNTEQIREVLAERKQLEVTLD